ncbi:MAG TPA: hypothetical protein VMM80_02240 [Bacteroidota bacterium]|nr:hypothetical protein [Bacteroidota bacterium]
MATVRWLLAGSMLVVFPLIAGTPETPHRTLTELRCELFTRPAAFAADSGVAAAAREAEGAGRKAPGLAAVYSLIVPGMGELYAGDFSSGKYFLMSEGVLWLTYAAFEVYGNSVRNDARLYAVTYAGVNPAGKSDQFYVDVGNFINTAAYNDKKLRDRTPDLVYDPAAGYGWQWGSDGERSTFRGLRVHSENMFNNKKFVGAAILVNHVASAINAARAAIAHNGALKDLLGDLTVSASAGGGAAAPGGFAITLSRGF